MTNLVKKSIDIEKVLEKPRQSCWERLMTWGLSKPAIVAIFVAITGWFGKAKADNMWGMLTFTRVNESFQNTRKFIFITGFFLILICAVLALFKKVSWFFLWCILSWLSFVAIAGLIIDSLVYEFEPIYLPFIMVGIILILLPCLISVIQYKRKKIEKKLLKKRLFICLIGAFVLLFGSIVIYLYDFGF